MKKQKQIFNKNVSCVSPKNLNRNIFFGVIQSVVFSKHNCLSHVKNTKFCIIFVTHASPQKLYRLRYQNLKEQLLMKRTPYFKNRTLV